MPRRKLIVTPSIDALVYDSLFSIPAKQARELPSKFYKASINSKSARRFCSNGSLEDKLELLSTIGADWYLFIGNKKTFTKDWLQSVLQKYSTNNASGAMDMMTQGSTCVVGSKEFVQLLSLMSATSSTSTYSFNYYYNKIGYAIKKWRKNLSASYLADAEEVKDSISEITGYLFNIIRLYETVQGCFGISQNAFKILIYMYRFRNQYILSSVLKSVFEGDISATRINIAIKELSEKNLIQKHFNWKVKSSTITATGILKISEFNKFAVTQNV